MMGRMSQVSNEGDAYRAGSKGIFEKATDKDIYAYSERSKFQISSKNVFHAGVGVGINHASPVFQYLHFTAFFSL